MFGQKENPRSTASTLGLGNLSSDDLLRYLSLAIANYNEVRAIRKKKKILYHFMTGWRKPLENIPILIPSPERGTSS
jgi:hypothetical protein